MNCPGECAGGGYAIYSYSKKGQEFKKNLFSQTKSGSNLSFGLYAGVGIASFRVGVNRMLFKEESGNSLWGKAKRKRSVFQAHLSFYACKTTSPSKTII